MNTLYTRSIFTSYEDSLRNSLFLRATKFNFVKLREKGTRFIRFFLACKMSDEQYILFSRV